jgi:glutathione S-transferase
MKTAGIPFREQRLLLDEPFDARIRAHSPSAKVPCLHDGPVVVWVRWRSRISCRAPPWLWPAESVARAWARSAAAKMHSGFSNLRNEFGMNLRLSETRLPSPTVAAEIERVSEIWSEGRSLPWRR